MGMTPHYNTTSFLSSIRHDMGHCDDFAIWLSGIPICNNQRVGVQTVAALARRKLSVLFSQILGSSKLLVIHEDTSLPHKQPLDQPECRTKCTEKFSLLKCIHESHN